MSKRSTISAVAALLLAGASLSAQADGYLETHEYNAELLATRFDDRRFQVVTLEPLEINTEDFGLAPGLESLRKVAGLSAIGRSVPANAVLIFAAR